jgi:uncharacterized repeat protein (TIGR01451 family)
VQHVVLTEYHFPERRECLDVKSSTSFRCSGGESLKQLGLRIAFLVLGSVVALAHAGYGGVVAPPTISKAFGAATIPLNGTTTLTFTYTNPNAGTALTGVSFTDTLPSGLIFPPPDGFTGNCSGTEMFVGTDTVSLTGGTVPANGSCFLTVGAVEGTTAGVKNNTSGNITSTNGGTGNTALASITVIGPTNTPTNTPTITPTRTPTGTPTPIPVMPTLNESGMLVFGLLIAAAGLLLLVRRH